MTLLRSLPPAPQDERLVKACRGGMTGVASSSPQQVVMFLLWLDGGYLSFLEGVTADDHWPDEREIEVVRVRPERRKPRWKWPWSRHKPEPSSPPDD